MKVVVSEAGVELAETDEFKSLSVEILRPRSEMIAIGSALAAFDIVLNNDHAWIPLDWLRAGVDESEYAQFDAMAQYAQSKGWLGKDSTRVRAHLKWSGLARALS